jgi:hypothetical protein
LDIRVRAKADRDCAVVAAASVCAKVYRDDLMIAAAGDEEGLVLAMVELQRQRFARLDVQELADVLLGVGEDQLVPPGLFDTTYRLPHQ